MSKMVRIRVTIDTKTRLSRRRLYPREPYDRVLNRLLDDLEDTSPAALRRYEKILADVKRGNFKTNAQVKREWGL